MVRHRKGVLVVAHRCGIVLANAGIDASNVAGRRRHHVLLLPRGSATAPAAQSARALRRATGVEPGVVIIDSLGRAWRNGTVGVALGAAGLPALLDLRGKPDLFGRALRTTQVGIADEIAAAASLLMGQADEGTPVVAGCAGFDRPDGRWPARRPDPLARSSICSAERPLMRGHRPAKPRPAIR